MSTKAIVRLSDKYGHEEDVFIPSGGYPAGVRSLFDSIDVSADADVFEVREAIWEKFSWSSFSGQTIQQLKNQRWAIDRMAEHRFLYTIWSDTLVEGIPEIVESDKERAI